MADSGLDTLDGHDGLCAGAKVFECGGVLRALLGSDDEGDARAETVGVGSGVFRNLLQALERQRFLQRSLGYPDTLKIDSALAKNGRVSFLRAMPRLLELCARFDIRTDNIATHFPSLGQPFRCA